MLAHPNHYQAGGGNSYPAIPEGGDAGYPTTIIGSAVTFGTVVTAGFTDSAGLLDTGLTDGSRSPLQVCELPVEAGMADVRAALYGVVQEPGGIPQDKIGRVASGFVTIKARVFVADGGEKSLQPLMWDSSDATGRLVAWNGTGKCIALLAHKVADPGAAAAESLEWVHFNGVYGFAASDRIV
jgi:hypothetical protein